MRAVLAVALVAALGRDGGAGVDAGRDAAGARPRVELGTGATSFQPLPPTGATGWVRPGDFVVLHDSMPDPVRGLTLEVTVRCEGVIGGRSAEDARVVTIVDEISG